MRSDSVKNMSAYADQNHAPSLTDVRLEYYLSNNHRYTLLSRIFRPKCPLVKNTCTWHFHRVWPAACQHSRSSNGIASKHLITAKPPGHVIKMIIGIPGVFVSIHQRAMHMFLSEQLFTAPRFMPDYIRSDTYSCYGSVHTLPAY